MGREAARNAFFSGVDFHSSKCDESQYHHTIGVRMQLGISYFGECHINSAQEGLVQFQPRTTMPSTLPITVTLATLQQSHHFALSAAIDLIVLKTSFSLPRIFAVEFTTVKWRPFHKLKARPEVSTEAGTISPEIRVVQ
jgi:hypothetical protein